MSRTEHKDESHEPWIPGWPEPRLIKVGHAHPPIPIREMDYSATFEGYEPGEPIGRGATEAAAIADLLLESDYMGPVLIRAA